MQTNLVSIMMPAYNAENFIQQAIESVLAQTYPHWELIIVNDGSTDKTPEIAASYDDPRIRVLHQANSGEAAARNNALDHMNGAWVGFLDADDLYLPEHLALTIEYLENHPQRDAVYTDGFHIDPQGNRLQSLSSRRRGPFEGRIFEEVVRASDVFGPPLCTILRREIISKNRLKFDQRIVIGPDWDFLTHFADLADFGYIDQPTCLYRIHETNISVQVDLQRRAGYLAICRENAIKIPSFNHCSDEVRATVMYDLMVNLSANSEARQTEISGWEAFTDLPHAEQARIYRVMATNAITKGNIRGKSAKWLQKARQLDPSNWRNALLLQLYQINPGLCRAFLQAKNKIMGQKFQNTLPLSDIK